MDNQAKYPQLTDIFSHGLSATIKLDSDKFNIGRSITNSFVVRNSWISRTHCTLELNNNREWVIIDKSSQGTQVNGETLQKETERILEDGDIISLSEEDAYVFELPEGNASTNTDSSSEAEISNADTFKEDCLASSSFEEVGTSAQQSNHEINKLEILNIDASSSTSLTCKRENSSDTNEDGKAKKIKSDNIHDELQCSICTEMFFKAQTLSCSHTFCKYCIEQWKKSQNCCPICRKKITTLSPSLVIDNIIEKIIQDLGTEIQDQRREVMEERNVVPSTSGVNTFNLSDNANVRYLNDVLEIDDYLLNSDDSDVGEGSSSLGYMSYYNRNRFFYDFDDSVQYCCVCHSREHTSATCHIP